jgi:autotransporter-associated beta strand protein
MGSGGLLENGPGTLILSADDTYSGGTIVDDGTLIATTSNALPSGSSLTVGGGGPFAPDCLAGGEPSKAAGGEASPGEAVAAVPEPGSLALLSMAGIVAAAAAWRRKRNLLY